MYFYCFYRFDWYQTETHVVVTLMIKKSKKENVNVDYGEKTVWKLILLSCMGKELSILAFVFLFVCSRFCKNALLAVDGQFENEIPICFIFIIFIML